MSSQLIPIADLPIADLDVPVQVEQEYTPVVLALRHYFDHVNRLVLDLIVESKMVISSNKASVAGVHGMFTLPNSAEHVIKTASRLHGRCASVFSQWSPSSPGAPAEFGHEYLVGFPRNQELFVLWHKLFRIMEQLAMIADRQTCVEYKLAWTATHELIAMIDQ